MQPREEDWLLDLPLLVVAAPGDEEPFGERKLEGFNAPAGVGTNGDVRCFVGPEGLV